MAKTKQTPRKCPASAAGSASQSAMDAIDLTGAVDVVTHQDATGANARQGASAITKRKRAPDTAIPSAQAPASVL